MLLWLALVGLLSLGVGVGTLVLVRGLSAQLAVLTIRVTDLVEQIDALETRLQAAGLGDA